MNEDMSISLIVTFCEADKQYLPRALAAMKWQLADEDELLLVKDAPEAEKASRPGWLVETEIGPADAPTVYHTLGSWKGISKARNAAARNATKRWLKFMDVDDVLAPFALSAFRKKTFRMGTRLVKGGQTTLLNGNFNLDTICGAEQLFMNDVKIFVEMPWACLMDRNPALVSHTFIERAGFMELGGFDEKLDWEEEWDLWLRFFTKFGTTCLAAVRDRICYYWIDEAERASKKRVHEVEVDGKPVDVHQYLHDKYPGCNPGGKFAP